MQTTPVLQQAGRQEISCTAQAIGQMLTRIGIKSKVKTMPKGDYFSRASRGGQNGTPEFSFILVGDTMCAAAVLRSLAVWERVWWSGRRRPAPQRSGGPHKGSRVP